MEYATVFMVLAVLFGLYMTWGVGANDVANAMGASVGAGAISVRVAIGIAAVFEFGGAVLAGGNVTRTIRKGIIDAGHIPSPQILIFGMLASLLAAAIWLMVASYFGWPVSTTHSIVGAVVGFGVAGLGVEAIAWERVGSIVASWVVSPLLGGCIAYLLLFSIHHWVLDTDAPFLQARRYGPVYVFLMGVLISLVTLFKGLAHLHLELTIWQTLGVAVTLGFLISLAGRLLIQRVRVDPAAEKKFQFDAVERVFSPLCVFTACAMAFAHGSNDVANGVGPLAAIVSMVQTGDVAQDSPLPVWILVLGGAGIILGLSTMGYKVIRTVGTRITQLTPTRAFCAELSAAGTIVVASRLGLPVSTTHTIVGAVLGVGLARGIAAIDLRVVLRIVASWLLTLPVGAALAAFFFFFFKGLFL